MSKMTYNITKIKYDKAVELLAEGILNQSEIAQEVKIARNTVAKIKNDPQTAKIIHDCANEDIKLAAKRAAETLIKLLSAKSEMVRLEASKRILELCGIQVIDKLEIEAETVIIKDDIDE